MPWQRPPPLWILTIHFKQQDIAVFYPASGNLQQGFSLLEVLIAGAIMGSGLAGLAALLLTSVSGTAQSSNRTSASFLAESMAVQIGISPASEQVFLQSPPKAILHCDAKNTCSAAQFSAANLKLWQIELADRLPAGSGTICRDSTPFDGSTENTQCDGGKLLVVKVFWQSPARLGASLPRVVEIAR